MHHKNSWAYEKNTRGDITDLIFLEWKYFSFQSEEIDGFVTYVIGNPRNLFRTGRGMICYGFYYEGEYRKGCFDIPFKKIDIGRKKWIFDENSIKSPSDDRWILRGKDDDITWNLEIRNLVSGGSFKYQGDRTLLGQRWVNWDVISNISKTRGQIRIDGKTLDINCLGYVDTNYGHWETYRNLWKWVQAVVPDYGGLGFSFFNIQNKNLKRNMSKLFLNIKDKKYDFDDIRFRIKTKGSEDIPDKYIVKAFDKKQNIDLEMLFNIDEYDLIKVKLFRIFSLVDLYLLRGDMELKIHFKDTGRKICIDCRASGEYPKKPLI